MLGLRRSMNEGSIAKGSSLHAVVVPANVVPATRLKKLLSIILIKGRELSRGRGIIVLEPIISGIENPKHYYHSALRCGDEMGIEHCFDVLQTVTSECRDLREGGQRERTSNAGHASLETSNRSRRPCRKRLPTTCEYHQKSKAAASVLRMRGLRHAVRSEATFQWLVRRRARTLLTQD